MSVLIVIVITVLVVTVVLVTVLVAVVVIAVVVTVVMVVIAVVVHAGSVRRHVTVLPALGPVLASITIVPFPGSPVQGLRGVLVQRPTRRT